MHCTLPQSSSSTACDNFTSKDMHTASTLAMSLASKLDHADVNVEHILTMQVISRGSQERHGDVNGPKPFWSRSQLLAGCIAAAVFWMHTRNRT